MRRVVGWGVFVAALVGLGVLIHAGAGPTPRWAAQAEGPGIIEAAVTSRGHVITMRLHRSAPNGPLEAREARTGRLLWRAWEDNARAVGFCFSPAGRWAAGVAQRGGTAALRWVDLDGGREREAPGYFHDVFFSPDERLLFAREPLGTVHVLDPETGGQVAALRGAHPPGYAWAGPWLLLPGPGGVRAWDTRALEGVTLQADPVGWVAAAGRRALVATETGYDLWGFDGRPRRLAAIPAAAPFPTYHSRDGRVAVLAPVGSLEVWDLTVGRKLWEHPRPGSTWAPEVSPDGRFVAVRDSSDVCHLLDVRAKRPAWTLPTKGPATFSPDSASVLIVSSGDRGVDLHDPASGRKQGGLPMHSDRNAAPAFHAGGRQMWVRSEDRALEPAEGWLAWLPRPGRIAGALYGLEWPRRRVFMRIAGGSLLDYVVAADGSFLLTVHVKDGELLIRGWDLPPPKPWAWIVGVPLALGAALLGLRAWWARRPAGQPEREGTAG